LTFYKKGQSEGQDGRKFDYTGQVAEQSMRRVVYYWSANICRMYSKDTISNPVLL